MNISQAWGGFQALPTPSPYKMWLYGCDGFHYSVTFGSTILTVESPAHVVYKISNEAIKVIISKQMCPGSTFCFITKLILAFIKLEVGVSSM